MQRTDVPRVVASLCVLAGLSLVSYLGAQEAVNAKQDSCTIPLSIFIPSFKKAIEEKTSPESKVRKAALKALSGKLEKGSVKLFPKIGGIRKGISEEFKIEPASGEVVLDGVTWKWEITATVGSVWIESGESPVYARFKWRPRFTISMKSTLADSSVVQVLSDDATRQRWFYIVAGAGKKQDGTKAPKNAPDLGK